MDIYTPSCENKNTKQKLDRTKTLPLEKGRHVVRHEVGDAEALQLVVPGIGPDKPFRRRPKQENNEKQLARVWRVPRDLTFIAIQSWGAYAGGRKSKLGYYLGTRHVVLSSFLRKEKPPAKHAWYIKQRKALQMLRA